MEPMLARALQVFLVILGILFFLGIRFAVPAAPAHGADAAFRFGVAFAQVLYLALSFLCFIGAYRIGKRKKKKNQS